MTGRTGTLAVAGGSIAYDVAGKGPALVLVPAAIADRRMWEREALRYGRTRRVVRYDPRGLGGSPPAEADYSDAEDLRALLDGLGIDRADLVAASHSGQIALEFARRSPERVGRVVVAGSGLGLFVPPAGTPAARSFEDLEARFGAIAEAYRAGRRDRAIDGVLELFAASVPSAGRPALRRMVAENLDEIVTDRSAARARGGLTPEGLGELGMPVLVLVGTKDHPAIAWSSRSLSGAIPGAREELLAGADHLPNLSRPEAFDRAVEGFFEERAGP
jgi:3-oxoadipate enol-lactonase